MSRCGRTARAGRFLSDGRGRAARAGGLLSLLRAAAGVLVAVSLLAVLRSGLEERSVALAFGVLMAVGELTRWSGPGLREAAPLGS
ncbi:hypothetical protein AB0J81_05720, partial [Streptomyces bobili]